MADYLFGRSQYNVGGVRSIRDRIYGTLYPLAGSGSVTPYSIMVHSEQGATNNWQCAIYDSSYNLIAKTEERLIGWGDWFEFVLDSPPALTRGQSYYLVAWSDNRQDGGYVSGYGYLPGAGRYQDLEYADPPVYPDPLVPSSHDRAVSIYCTYLPGTTESKEFTIDGNIVERNEKSFTIDGFLRLMELSITIKPTEQRFYIEAEEDI